MKAVSDLLDNRINSRNILVELTIGEYLHFAQDILDKNEYQRRRVRSSKTVYSLLRSDLTKGCIMPPIVLAITADLDGDEPTLHNFEDYLQSNKEHLVILDGLQRTYTILDLVRELKDKGDEAGLEVVRSSTPSHKF